MNSRFCRISPRIVRLFGALSLNFVLLVALWILFKPAVAKDNYMLPATLGSISGLVSDQNGQPVAEVEVSLFHSSLTLLAKTTTDNTGAYMFRPLLPGVYRLQVHDPKQIFALQFYTTTSSIFSATEIIVNGNHVTGVDVTLQPGARITGRLSIQGSVPYTQAGSNNNITVYTKQFEQWQSIATAEIVSQTGEYSVSALLPGVYRICAFGYLPMSYFGISGCYGGVDVSKATNITVTSAVTVSGIDIDLDAGQFEGVISGKVLADGQPLADMRVTVSSNVFSGDNGFGGGGGCVVCGGNSIYVYTKTGLLGEYEFHGLPTGYYFVTFSDPAQVYAAIWHNQQSTDLPFSAISPLRPIELTSGQVISNINVSMVRYGKIQGKLSIAGGEPAISQTIRIVVIQKTSDSSPSPRSYFLTTDNFGNYSLEKLFPGIYTLSFEYCVAQGSFQRCYYKTYGNVISSFGIEPTELTLAPGATLTGINALVGPDPQIFLPLITTDLTPVTTTVETNR